MKFNSEITSKEKYSTTLEITALSGERSLKQLTIFKEIGQSPNIGDFIQAIKTELGEQVEIEELSPLLEIQNNSWLSNKC